MLRRQGLAVFLLLAGLAQAAVQQEPADKVFSEFVCPSTGVFTLVEEPSAKWCVVDVDVNGILSANTSWGLLPAYVWSSNVGFWVEPSVSKCPKPFTRDLDRNDPVRVCSTPLDYRNTTRRPPVHRLIPLPTGTVNGVGVLRLGFGVQRQDGATSRCPRAFGNQHVVCEPHKTHRMLTVADDLWRLASGNRLLATVSNFEFAETAVVWYKRTQQLGYTGTIVVAMDAPTYHYLHNRQVPVALLRSVVPLDPCCLRRFKMTTWRATNDVKVRTILMALARRQMITMVDMDVPLPHSHETRKWKFSKHDVAGAKGFSFAWTHTRITAGAMELWQRVLHGVLTGGWDQAEYKFWAQKMIAEGRLAWGDVPDPINQISGSLHLRYAADVRQHAKGWVHPDVSTVRRLVLWHPSSVCNTVRPPSSDAPASPPLAEQPWSQQLACAQALVAAATVLDRTAVMRPAEYDWDGMRRWFPVVDAALLRAYDLFPDAFTGTDVATLAWQDVADHPVRPFASHHTVIMMTGNPATADLPGLVDALPPYMKLQLSMFITPRTPRRLRFKCMRDGGPASPLNPDSSQSCRQVGDVAANLSSVASWPLQWDRPPLTWGQQVWWGEPPWF